MMNQRELHQIDRDILVRLLEYCKYLYEEEKERTQRLEKKLNIFSVIVGGSISGILLLPIGKLLALFDNSGIRFGLILVIVLFSMSVLLFFLSSIFTILVYKVQRFERPCDPKIATLKAVSMESEKDMLAAIVADYTVATNRNHDINDRKARYLSKVLFFLLVGLVFFGLGIFSFNILAVLKGGR